MRTPAWAALALMSLAGPLLAQITASNPSGMESSAVAAIAAAAALPGGVVAHGYRLGPGDVLDVTVLNSPELSGRIQVDVDGTIVMPYGRTVIHAAGLTTRELAPKIIAALIRDQLAIHPIVRVQVTTVNSKAVVIVGGVKPITLQAAQPLPLLQALTQAGALNTSSASEVLVTRAGPKGPVTRSFSTSQLLLSADDPAHELLLRGGEEVRVLPVRHVYITGAVGRPGAYPLDESDPLNIMKILALAHGLLPVAQSNHAVLIRDERGRWVRIRVNIDAIVKSHAPDPWLQAEDVLYVPESTEKKVLNALMQSTANIVTTSGSFYVSNKLAH